MPTLPCICDCEPSTLFKSGFTPSLNGLTNFGLAADPLYALERGVKPSGFILSGVFVFILGAEVDGIGFEGTLDELLGVDGLDV